MHGDRAGVVATTGDGDSGRRCADCGGPKSAYNTDSRCGSCQRRACSAVGRAPLTASGFWYGERTRAALAARDLRTACRLYRLETGLSQTELGVLLGMEQSEVSTIERGRRSVRDIAVLERFRDALGAPGHLLGLAPGAEEESPPLDSVDDPAVTTKGEDPTKRREFITGALLAPLGISGPLRDLALASGPPEISRRSVEEIWAAVRQLFLLDDQYGGDTLAALASRGLHQVRRTLDEGPSGGRVERELLSAAGGLAEFTGWSLFEAGRQEAARGYFTEAICNARLADDEQMATLTLASMSLQALQGGHPREAVSLARAGRDAAAGWATPRVTALLAMREAAGCAGMRDESSFRNAMVRARRAFDKGRHEDDPHWVGWVNESEFMADEGASLMELDKYVKAERLLREALDAQEEHYQRNRALRTPRLATALLRRGDITQAAELASGAIPLFEEISSTRSFQGLRAFYAEVESNRNIPAVADFTERFRALVAPARGDAVGNR